MANLAPAMVEASYAGVPVIALTADRPAELRDTGANQTIDQARFFDGTVRWRTTSPWPSRAWARCATGARSSRARSRSATEAGRPRPGAPQRRLPRPARARRRRRRWVEPLGLAPLGTDPDERLPVAADARLDDDRRAAARRDPRCSLAGPERRPRPRRAERAASSWSATSPTSRPSDSAVALAEACGWPLLSEPSGNARSGDTARRARRRCCSPTPQFAEAHQPEIVVCVGTPGLSPLGAAHDPRGAARPRRRRPRRAAPPRPHAQREPVRLRRPRAADGRTTSTTTPGSTPGSPPTRAPARR